MQQNAYHKDDTYVPLDKQFRMMGIILALYNNCKQVVALGVPVSTLVDTGLFEKVVKMKYDIPNDKPELFRELEVEIEQQLKKIKTEV